MTPDEHLNLRAGTMDSEDQENEVPAAYDRSVPKSSDLKWEKKHDTYSNEERHVSVLNSHNDRGVDAYHRGKVLGTTKRGYKTTPPSPRTAKKTKVKNDKRKYFEAGKTPYRKFKCGLWNSGFTSRSCKLFATHYNKGRCGEGRLGLVEPNE